MFGFFSNAIGWANSHKKEIGYIAGGVSGGLGGFAAGFYTYWHLNNECDGLSKNAYCYSLAVNAILGWGLTIACSAGAAALSAGTLWGIFKLVERNLPPVPPAAAVVGGHPLLSGISCTQ